jgi:hypothetical protein
MHQLRILSRQRLVLLEALVFHLNEVSNLIRQLVALVHQVFDFAGHALLQLLKRFGKVLEDVGL